MSNRPYVERYPEYRGIRRVAVFLQRWPVYSKLKGEGVTELDFIQKDTPFLNALEPAERLDPRAVDVKDIDDGLMGQLLLEAFRYKGYDPFLAEIASSDQETVAGIMARYLDIAPRVDGFLFCFYSPTLYFSRAEKVPPDHRFRLFARNRPFAESGRRSGDLGRAPGWPRFAQLHHPCLYLSSHEPFQRQGFPNALGRSRLPDGRQTQGVVMGLPS
jgi:hypothetical protein